MENRKYEIVNEINALLWEQEDLGPTSLDMALDYRADDGLPEPTPEELAQMASNADAAADRANEIDALVDALREEYADLNGGEWPHYNDCTGSYMY